MVMGCVVGFRLGKVIRLKSDASAYAEMSIFAQNSLSSSSFLNFGTTSSFFIYLHLLFVCVTRRNHSYAVLSPCICNSKETICIGIPDEKEPLFRIYMFNIQEYNFLLISKRLFCFLCLYIVFYP